jgi:hypothetical protein
LEQGLIQPKKENKTSKFNMLEEFRHWLRSCFIQQRNKPEFHAAVRMRAPAEEEADQRCEPIQAKLQSDGPGQTDLRSWNCL